MWIDFASFKHLKLPISTKIPFNCLYLHDSYITKFDFMNYAFAKLLLAWLYYRICQGPELQCLLTVKEGLSLSIDFSGCEK